MAGRGRSAGVGRRAQRGARCRDACARRRGACACDHAARGPVHHPSERPGCRADSLADRDPSWPISGACRGPGRRPGCGRQRVLGRRGAGLLAAASIDVGCARRRPRARCPDRSPRRDRRSDHVARPHLAARVSERRADHRISPDLSRRHAPPGSGARDRPRRAPDDTTAVESIEVLDPARFEASRSVEYLFTLPLAPLPPGAYRLAIEAQLDRTTTRRDVVFAVR